MFQRYSGVEQPGVLTGHNQRSRGSNPAPATYIIMENKEEKLKFKLK